MGRKKGIAVNDAKRSMWWATPGMYPPLICPRRGGAGGHHAPTPPRTRPEPSPQDAEKAARSVVCINKEHIFKIHKDG